MIGRMETSAPGLWAHTTAAMGLEKMALFRILGWIAACFCALCIKYPSENCVFGRTVVEHTGFEPVTSTMRM